MRKAPSAKKKDEVRAGKWQERWFVLKKTTLYYYKQKGNTRPKGEIDLRAAHIECADSKTRKEFTIRIAQASQVFNYLQCSSQAEKEQWLDDIREAAGYKATKVEVERVQANEYYASFGVLKQGRDGNLRRVVLIPDEKKQLVHVAFEQQFVKRYSTGIIRKAVGTKEVTVSNFYEVRLVLCPDPRLPHDLKEKIFYVATRDESLSCATLLNNFCQGDRLKIQDLSNNAPKHKGFLEMQGLADRAWVRLWAVLVEKRCLLYNSPEDSIPVWVVWIAGKPTCEGRCGIQYRDPQQVWNFRFEDTKERDDWAAAFEEISRSFEEALTDQLKNLDVEKTPRMKTQRNTEVVSSSKKILDSTATYVVTFGHGRNGQLGNASTQTTSFPQLTRLLSDKHIRDVAAGDTFCCAVTRHGQCYAWGTGKEGELGLGQSALKKNYPCLVVSLRSTSVVAVSCGSHHVLGLTGNGQVFAWGSGEYGQLGHGGNSNCYKPKIIGFFRDLEVGKSDEGAVVVQISAGGNHSGAVIQGNTHAFTWGSNDEGQLGLGGSTPDKCIYIPKAVPTFSDGRKKCSSVSCGERTTGFLTVEGELFMCGANKSGQLGLGDRHNRNEPWPVDSKAFGSGTLAQVRQVACGAHHTLCVAGGQLYAWGLKGMNGLPGTTDMPGKPLGEATFISASGSHSAYIDDKFNLKAFGGGNEYGEWGILEGTEVKGMAEVNLHPSLDVLQVKCGTNFTIAMMEGKRPDNIYREKQTDRNAAEEFANRKAGELLQQLQNDAVQKPGTGDSNPVLNVGMPKNEKLVVGSSKPEPESPIPAPPEPKKQGVWKEVMDPKSGKPYYYHTITRQTRWKRPTDGLPIVKKHMPKS